MKNDFLLETTKGCNFHNLKKKNTAYLSITDWEFAKNLQNEKKKATANTRVQLYNSKYRAYTE